MTDEILIKLPDLLQKPARQTLEKLEASLLEQQLSLPQDPAFQKQLIKSLACSEFVSTIIIKSPKVLLELYDSGLLTRGCSTNQYVTELKSLLKDKHTEADLTKQLRIFRKKHMLRIAWRDLNDLASLSDTIYELSAMADVVLNFSVKFLTAILTEKYGTPTDKTGKTSEFNILALGKLGSFELNFSSDIDLIFCYSQTKLEYEIFFAKLAKMLLGVLNRTTEDGFVYRVDMRLRPYGSSGPLICSHKAITAYYQSQGREWERFALAKSRLTTPSFSGERLMRVVKNFVYRRHTDFGIISSLRDIKSRMRRESQNLEKNIKAGPGGIRELEFIVQVFQLIRGGKEPWFQSVSIFKTLPKLAEYQCLPASIVSDLLKAYKFLRIAEHHLQEINDQQTQTLPSDPVVQTQLAYAMNFESFESFMTPLDAHRDTILVHFNNMIAPPKDLKNDTLRVDVRFKQLIDNQLSSQQIITFFESLKDPAPQQSVEILDSLTKRYNFHAMSEEVKPKLALLLQQILPLIFEQDNSIETLNRVFRVFEKIIRRSIYLDLLLENPNAIIQLVKTCHISPWITSLLCEHPFLLDALIDKKALYQPYDTDKLQDQLRQHMLSIPFDDLEQLMDCLRHFKQAQVLRVALSDATHTLPLMKVSDHLTNTANVIVGYAQRIAWRSLVLKHGEPTSNHNNLNWDDFGIIAYGKLGGLELSYSSDLDLVFIQPETKASDMTDGEKPISSMQFFMRLAQRITHILSVGTSAGSLYEVDIRLRPSGSSGLLVSSFKSYARYLEEKAWTWEHQALIRTRLIVGAPQLKQDFAILRSAILTKQRDPEKLKIDIRDMRNKMQAQLTKHDANLFDINNDRGGIKDIEFIVQFLTLRYAHEHSELVEFPDNIRILEALMKYHYLSEQETIALSNGYCKLREINHRLALQNKSSLVEYDLVKEIIDPVIKIWNHFFE